MWVSFALLILSSSFVASYVESVRFAQANTCVTRLNEEYGNGDHISQLLLFTCCSSKQLLSQSRQCNMDLPPLQISRRFLRAEKDLTERWKLAFQRILFNHGDVKNRASFVPRRCALMLTGFSCQGVRIIRIGRVRAKLVEVDTFPSCMYSVLSPSGDNCLIA